MSKTHAMTNEFSGFPEEGLRFLEGLKRNNERPWFNARKRIYEESIKGPMNAFILALGKEFESFAPEIIATPKVSGYRIYRDTRFSANKAPYKTHVAAVFPHRGIEKHRGAGFYVHIAPDEVFVGGGIYRPSPADLFALREHIAARHADFRRILRNRSFRRLFGDLERETLTRAPRGFPRDHPADDLLRHKQFLAARQLDPGIAATPELHREVVRTFKTLYPMIRFLNIPIAERGRQSLQEPRIRT